MALFLSGAAVLAPALGWWIGRKWLVLLYLWLRMGRLVRVQAHTAVALLFGGIAPDNPHLAGSFAGVSARPDL